VPGRALVRGRRRGRRPGAGRPVGAGADVVREPRGTGPHPTV